MKNREKDILRNRVSLGRYQTIDNCVTHYIASIILYIVLERIVFYQADFVTFTDIVCMYKDALSAAAAGVTCYYKAAVSVARVNRHYSRQTINPRCDTHPRLEKSWKIRMFNFYYVRRHIVVVYNEQSTHWNNWTFARVNESIVSWLTIGL